MRRDDGNVPTTQPSGPGGRIRGIVDRSIAMYLFRMVRGRLNPPSRRRWQVRDLRADEVAYRIGASAMRPRVEKGTRGPMMARSTARRQLVRDTAVALAGIATVAVVAVNLGPSSKGEVLGATATPPAATELVTAGPTPTS